LQPATINFLKDAQNVVNSSEVISRYTIHSEKVIHYSEKEFQLSATQREEGPNLPTVSSFVTLPIPSAAPTQGTAYGPVTLSNPTTVQMVSSGSLKAPIVNADQTAATMSPLHRQLPKLTAEDQIIKSQVICAKSSIKCISAISLKSSPSVESFKSALSFQDIPADVTDKVDTIQGILHAFRTALETLETLVRKRIPQKDENLYFAAEGLKLSLSEGEKEVGDVYKSHCEAHGQLYIRSFTEHRKF
jgi:hypothetical protein